MERIERGAVATLPIDAELPLHEAAARLDVSQQCLIDWLESNGISRPQAGDLQHVRVIDLLHFREECDRASADAMAELSRQAQALRMGYD